MGCFIRGRNLNILIWIWKYFSWHYRDGCIKSKASKLNVCTTNVRESGIFHGLSLYSSLISLLSWLFSYLQKKKPWDQLYLPHFSSSLLSFCHLQTSMSSTMWCIHRTSLAFWTERDPFLLLLAPIQGFLLPFKWAVDEVSLIRLSQLTLVSAVCFPSKGVLTCPILFLYPPLCTFHPGFHPKKPFQQRSQWTPLYTTVPQWYRLFRMGH